MRNEGGERMVQRMKGKKKLREGTHKIKKH